MKLFLPIVTLVFSFSVIIFGLFFTIKYSHKERKECSSNSGYVSLFQTKDCVKSSLSANKADSSGIYDSTHGTYKCPNTISDRNSNSFATTELTLEYIAVQSIRSYSFE